MAINFDSITLEVIDISTNSSPDIYINQNGITFTKRVLDDLNYPQNVQYCLDSAQKIFAVRVCKGNEVKAAPFVKPKAEQTSTFSSSNKNLRDVITAMIPGYDPKQRYKVVGEYDSENRVMYFDMGAAKAATYHHSTNKKE